MDVFKFIIFFNLLTVNKRVLNLAGSLARSESHLLCVGDWLFTADVTHSCARAPLTQDQAWVDRESWWSASWYQQSQIGVVWFCQLKTYPIILNLFIYHHGTGPWGVFQKARLTGGVTFVSDMSHFSHIWLVQFQFEISNPEHNVFRSRGLYHDGRWTNSEL